MASSSREGGSRGGWEIKTDIKSTTTNGQTREKLTLHVKKRQPSESSRVKHESPPVEPASAKRSKKSKKGAAKSKAKSNTPTRRQVKEESTGSEGATGETPDPDDPTPPSQVDEAALQQARQEFINNAILKEILNEKKRALFESDEFMQLIRERTDVFVRSQNSAI